MNVSRFKIQGFSVLLLLLTLAAVAQPVPPTTAFTRYLMTSTNQAQFQTRAGVGTNGATLDAGVTNQWKVDATNAVLGTALPAANLTGTIDDARLPATISSDITGNAATATTATTAGTVTSIAGNAAQVAAIMGTNSGLWFGVWDNYRNGTPLGAGDKCYVTTGPLHSQRRITHTMNDATCELGTPNPFYYSGKLYFSHLTRGYGNPNNETNTFGIMRSDDWGYSWVRHAFIDCSNTIPESANPITAVWDPHIFTDRLGNVHCFIDVGTNKTPATSSANMLTYKLFALDNTLTNWSQPVLCAGITPGSFECNVEDLDGTNYVIIKRNLALGGYLEAYTSTDLTNWVSYQTGNWLGFGNNVEAPDLNRLNDGSWVLTVSSNGSYAGVFYSTSTDFTNWATLKPFGQSGKYGHGSMVQVPTPIVSKSDLGMYPMESNTTFGVTYALGQFTNTPPISQTLIVGGGTIGWLSLDGTTATGLSIDPYDRNVPFYIAGRYGSAADTYMLFLGGQNDVQFYGDIRSILPGNTNTFVSFGPNGDLTNSANLSVSGTATVADLNVTGTMTSAVVRAASIYPLGATNAYLYADATGKMVGTNNGAGLTNLAHAPIVAATTGATVTPSTNATTGQVTYTVGASGSSVGTVQLMGFGYNYALHVANGELATPYSIFSTTWAVIPSTHIEPPGGTYTITNMILSVHATGNTWLPTTNTYYYFKTNGVKAAGFEVTAAGLGTTANQVVTSGTDSLVIGSTVTNITIWASNNVAINANLRGSLRFQLLNVQ